MNKIIVLISAVFMLLFTSGCQDWLDVNHDPNVLEEIPDAKVLLPAAEVGLGNNLMGWDMGFAGAFWSEYWTQAYSASQFKFLCEYNETSFGTAYQSLTAGVQEDLNKIKKIASNANDHGSYFIAEVLSIFTWQVMTDVWGNIPYSEALKGDEGNSTPKFDKSEDIYADLLKRVDELLKVDLSKANVDTEYDFIYAGDMAKWKKFANSVKLKLMLRLSETSGYDNAKVLAFVKANDFLTASAKISGKVWSDGQEGKRHPMREFQEGGAGYLTTNVIACKNFIDYLQVNNDPRIATLFTMADKNAGTYRGAFFGDFDSKEASDGSKKDKDVTYSKALFKYAAWKATDKESAIKQIGMQKWVANANYQHIESFLERNRIKYPALYMLDIVLNRKQAFNDPLLIGNITIAVNGRAKLNASLPASPIYPDAVINRNPNSPAQKANLGEKVWWNVKPEIVVKELDDQN